MNSKAIKTLKQYASVSRMNPQEVKQKFLDTPRNKRGDILENMRTIVRLYWERIKRERSSNNE